MEQQQISVAKAGVVCSLPARTAIIAAANPVGGHYNRAKTVAENLKMGSALLSRFDLVFILIDKPDEEQDQRLTEHVMALHSKHLGIGVAETQMRGGSAQTLASTQGIGQLAERLAPAPGLIWWQNLKLILICPYIRRKGRPPAATSSQEVHCLCKTLCSPKTGGRLQKGTF